MYNKCIFISNISMSDHRGRNAAIKHLSSLQRMSMTVCVYK